MKKGYIFSADAALGVVILIIGLAIFYAFTIAAPQKETTESISRDVIGILSSIRVEEVIGADCDGAYDSINELCRYGYLANDKITIYELLGQLYHMHERERIDTIITEMIIEPGLIPENYAMRIMLRDTTTGELAQLYPVIVL